MIKINLLQSVNNRPTGAAFVEDRVSSTRTQTLLLGMIVLALLVLGMGYDYVSASHDHLKATQDLEKQRRINEQMIAVKKEQAELEKKIGDINLRIEAIQKLRASQQGPGAVLTEIKNRFDGVPGLYLKSVEQKDGELIIKGESPNEASVTRFGQSLEFSSGLFTNLNIETQREVSQGANQGANQTASKVTATTSARVEADDEKSEVVSFTIKCTYAPSGQKNSNPAPPANQVARNN